MTYSGFSFSIGILDSAVWFLFLTTDMLKIALYDGSSKQGNAFLALVASNCVTANHLLFQTLFYSLIHSNRYYGFFFNCKIRVMFKKYQTFEFPYRKKIHFQFKKPHLFITNTIY